ncbi:hypothetical protein [Streptomyces zaomyceticus]|uniref:hypothetical protein n=1 Tax=Streptomyces zaomyceticus TaxID=68286 RepID=UPI003413EDA4
MIVLIGPQSTEEQRGDLEELAGLLHAVRMTPDVTWAEVSRFVVVPEWERCPIAATDVGIAVGSGLPVDYLDEDR